MRALHFAAAAVALVGAGFAILAGGRALAPAETASVGSRQAGPVGLPAPAAEAVRPRRPAAPARAIGSGEIAPPPLDPSELEWAEPRAPLGELGLALPPKRPVSTDWEGTLLHRPVAPAAGLVEAMGHSVAIAGVDLVDADETCLFEGEEWACGVRARAAFRAFLRGRSVTCAVQPEAGPETATARCRLGNQDVGQWLVSNGWARAAAGGPYREAEEKARSAKKGIFGRPPDKNSLPPISSTTSALPRPPTAPTAPSE